MKDKILNYMKRLVRVPGISDTEAEKKSGEEAAAILRGQTYFMKNPDACGNPVLEQDHLKRTLPFGLVRGNGKKTVILTGHYDVVGVGEYGPFQDAAFDVEELERRFAAAGQEVLGQDAWADLTSGEWMFGRGTADMKGGLAAGLAVLEYWGDQALAGRIPDGNILFLAVPDEESYSLGMRSAAGLLLRLKAQYDLEYECLVDLEPCERTKGTQEVFIGSAGKWMPVVLVQGKKAHISQCYEGINAIGVLGEFFNRTELSPEFADGYEDERCVPPTWLQFRDRKAEYDVSVPSRACGYMNLITFSRTPEELMERLKAVGEQSWAAYRERMERSERELGRQESSQRNVDQWNMDQWNADQWNTDQRNTDQRNTGGDRNAETGQVLGYGELLEKCRGREDFTAFQDGLLCRIKKQVESGSMNYPQAAVEVMEKMLDFSGITTPVMVIGFAPPFYPAYHSDRLAGRGEAGTGFFMKLNNISQTAYEIPLKRKHYFTGISDLSYCGVSGMPDLNAYTENAPLWGDLYKVDFEGMAQLNIPSVLYGPWGKDIHQMTERVNIKSLTVELPGILQKFIEQVFANRT